MAGFAAGKKLAYPVNPDNLPYFDHISCNPPPSVLTSLMDGPLPVAYLLNMRLPTSLLFQLGRTFLMAADFMKGSPTVLADSSFESEVWTYIEKSFEVSAKMNSFPVQDIEFN